MKIVVITGGTSGEREVSIASTEFVCKSLQGHAVSMFVFPEEREKFLAVCETFDVAIPVIHGAGGEDGELQIELEQIGLPYVFSTPLVHKLGINKRACKNIATLQGASVPREFTVSTAEFPLFIKPNQGGSSVSSGICNTKEDLDRFLESNGSDDFLLEELVFGEEYTVGVIESNGEVIALPIIKIIPPGVFFDYESKYNPENLAQEIFPESLDLQLKEDLEQIARGVHTAIGARHISRSDFIVSQGKIYFLEINTIPGMTKISLAPKMLAKKGLSFSELLNEWCQEVLKKSGSDNS